MKKILGFTLLIVMSLPSNAQSLKCTLASDTILIGDSVLVEFENATCRDIYVSIALEKKIGEHWILYSRDVMVNSFSKLSVQNIVKKHKEKSIAFQLQDPELLNPDNTPAIGDIYKNGIFRVVVSFGFNVTSLNQIINLDLYINDPEKSIKSPE